MRCAICSVVSYDNIDKSGRNTPLRLWQHFSCSRRSFALLLISPVCPLKSNVGSQKSVTPLSAQEEPPRQRSNSIHSRNENQPEDKELQQSVSIGKIMLIVFFDCRSVLHSRFVPRGHRVNRKCCLSVSQRVREMVRKKQREIRRQRSSFLTHNAPANTALFFQRFFVFP
jgi:hypothetical protein